MSTVETELRYAKNSTGMTLAMIILRDEATDDDESIQLEGTVNWMIHLRRPDGTVLDLPAGKEFSDTESDIIKYTVTDPDLLSRRGRWQYWASYVRDGRTRITYDRFGFWVT